MYLRVYSIKIYNSLRYKHTHKHVPTYTYYTYTYFICNKTILKHILYIIPYYELLQVSIYASYLRPRV